MTIIYKTFSETEITSLCELIKQLGYEHSETSLQDNVKAVRNNGGEVFVAELDGKIIGCASAIIDIRLAAGKSGEIVSVVVENAFRGKGIGTALIRECESWLKNTVSIIRIRANTKRTEAPSFYGSLGYTLQKHQSIFMKNL